jgi:hypothetical protein
MSKFDAQFAGRLDGQTVLVTGTTRVVSAMRQLKVSATAARLC